MTKIKHFDSCSIFGWMIDPNGMDLLGTELFNRADAKEKYMFRAVIHC